MIPARDLLLAAALFVVLGAAVLLATAGWIAALEARLQREKGAARGEVAGWASFAAVHTVAAVWAWYALAFVVRPFG